MSCGLRAAANDAAPTPSLRVGVLLDRMVVPRWTAETLAALRASRDASLVLCVVNAQDQTRRSLVTRLRSAARHARTLAFDLYERVDRRLVREPGDPLDPVDVERLLEGVERLPVQPSKRGSVDRLHEADLREICSRDLDVIVRFGFGILRGDVLRAARYGVWSHHHGDSRRYRGLPPCFWEIRDDTQESGAILQRLGETLDGGDVLARVLVPTDHKSLHRNRRGVYLASTVLLPETLALLRRSGWDAIAAQPCFVEASPVFVKVYRRPTNMDMAVFLFRQAARKLRGRGPRGRPRLK